MKKMVPNRSLVLSLLLAMSGSTFAAPESGRPTVSLYTSLYGNAVDENLHTARLTGTAIEGELNYALRENLQAKLRAGVQLEVGSSQAFYSDDYSPRQIPKLREASLHWKPWNFAGIKIGALNQDGLDSPVLTSSQTFPALLESARLEGPKLSAYVFAQQAVPTSTSLSDSYAGKKGGVPLFFLERVGVEYRPESHWELKAAVSHYSFESLTDQTAYQSRFAGNSVIGVGPTNADFAYAFQGFETKFGLKWSSPWNAEPAFTLNWLYNPQAPSGQNQGYDVRFAVAVSLGPQLKIIPFYNWFRVESDVSPAYYNMKEVGHSNREGFSLGAEVQWGKERDDRYAVGGRWTESHLIRGNPYQSDFRYISIYVRGTYDVL